MIQLPTFAFSAIKANTNRHNFVKEKNVPAFGVRQRVVCFINGHGNHKTVTEIIEKMISPALFG